MRTLILIAVGVAFGFPALADDDEPCEIGKFVTLHGCSASITASWDEDAENECTFNPLPGYVVVEARESVHSERSGSLSVSTLAAGSTYASEAQFESARKSLLNAAAKDGKNEYSGQINSAAQSYMNRARSYSASHNTVVLTVRATGDGNFFDQKRAWMEASVTVKLLCVGVPDVPVLRKQIADKAGLVLVPKARKSTGTPDFGDFPPPPMPEEGF